MEVTVCFKIPGEDITIFAVTVKELIRQLKGYDLSMIAHVWLGNNRLYIAEVSHG